MHIEATEFIRKYGFDPLVVALRVHGDVVLLESQHQNHTESKFSFLAGKPKSSIKISPDFNEYSINGEIRRNKDNPWKALQSFRKDTGWLFGWLAYDMKNFSEDLNSANKDELGFPLAHFFEPDFLIRYSHQNQQAELVQGTWPDNLPDNISGHFEMDGLKSNKTSSEYMAGIRLAQQKIFEGEFYEINLSHRFTAGYSGEPLYLYNQMKQKGPVPFGAYIFADDRHICCASPERFLKKSGQKLISDPIKGTVSRGNSEDADRQKISEELLSEKNKAENLMIVDLVRHDFSKVCRPSTVTVSKLFEVQTFDTLHQLVSRVEGEISEPQNVFSIIEACFPMGSMTGAPKISVMKYIDNIEKYNRGVYSGAIGYINPDDDFDFNVVIRTALLTNGRLHYSAGGAITSGSDPAEEWEETKVKTKALREL